MTWCACLGIDSFCLTWHIVDHILLIVMNNWWFSNVCEILLLCVSMKTLMNVVRLSSICHTMFHLPAIFAGDTSLRVQQHELWAKADAFSCHSSSSWRGVRCSSHILFFIRIRRPESTLTDLLPLTYISFSQIQQQSLWVGLVHHHSEVTIQAESNIHASFSSFVDPFFFSVYDVS